MINQWFYLLFLHFIMCFVSFVCNDKSLSYGLNVCVLSYASLKFD